MEQMLTDLFLKLLNMSISGSFLIGAVILLRLIFRKAPKWFSCLLWLLAGVRLILPVSLQSALSLIPSAETVPPEILYEETPQIHSGIASFNSVVNPVIGEALAPTTGASVNPVQVITIIGAYLWVIGAVALLSYALISYIMLKRKTSTATRLRDNIFQSEAIGSPFVMGLIKPRIFLPYNIAEAEAEYVTAHEKSHIKRGDHLIKPLAYLLLCVHWFNPLVWLAYVLLCRDIEMACDERVIKDFDSKSRRAYSEALLSCSINSRKIVACPLAFGEVGVKERIKGVMNYKKPAFWVIIIALLSCVAVAVCFLTDPVKEEIDVPFENSDFSPVIDEVTSDIDSDGKDEHCVLTYGPTSGLYTVVFTVTEAGAEKAEYINTFNMPYTGGTAFYKKDERVQLVCDNSIYQNGQSVKTEDVYLDIKIEDSNIALYNGEDKIPYWGEQGITPSEFFKKLNTLEKAVGEAVIRENYNGGQVGSPFESHEILFSSKDDGKKILTVYALTHYEEYSFFGPNGLTSEMASGSQVEIVFDVSQEGVYKLKKYRELGKGDDIEDYLPDDYEFDEAEAMKRLQQYTYEKALNRFGLHFEDRSGEYAVVDFRSIYGEFQVNSMSPAAVKYVTVDDELSMDFWNTDGSHIFGTSYVNVFDCSAESVKEKLKKKYWIMNIDTSFLTEETLQCIHFIDEKTDEVRYSAYYNNGEMVLFVKGDFNDVYAAMPVTSVVSEAEQQYGKIKASYYYEMKTQETDSLLIPKLSLYERTKKNNFSLSYDLLSSQICWGTYTVEKGKLRAVDQNGNEYVFKEVDDETLKFIAEESDALPNIEEGLGIEITDRTEFVLTGQSMSLIGDPSENFEGLPIEYEGIIF